jgi:hypothetical protein
MKYQFKRTPMVCAATLCAAVLAGSNANADPITGSIGFGASGVSIDSLNLSTATTFSVANPFTTTETGTYSAVPLETSVTFNGFTFNPPAASVNPLWTFDVGTTVYSFDATSVSSSYNSLLRQWDIGGNGIAMITGFTDTPGQWNVNLSQTGASFVFDASEGSVPVQDGGSTVAMLGGAMLGLGALSRKLAG